MHTFFINTSKRELNGYDVLFDIHYENKTLVSMECLMSDWYDKEKGYIACVKQMSDMIDGHVELNNAFNLILYIDLPENKAYSSILRDAFHDKERDECCRAMHILFTHIISESIVQELADSGRRPQNVLIMFGEEKKFADFGVAANDPRRLGVTRKLFDFIGLPKAGVIENIAKSVDSSDAEDKVSAFRDQILQVCGEELVPGVRSRYQNALQFWCDELINEANIEKANDYLFDRISNINRVESDRIGIETVSCPYDCYACRVNKSVLYLSELNIALHLLKCVDADSVFEQGNDGRKVLMDFHPYTVQEIAPILKIKKDIYSEKAAEIESLASSYADLGLAPRMKVFDNAKFGLDMFGDKDTELVINSAAADSGNKKDKGKSKESEDGETIAIKGNTKEVSVIRKQGRTLFSADEYQPLDYDYQEELDQVMKKSATPDQYIDYAKKERKNHLDYLKKIKVHISRALSNYAGKSKENKPALLRIGEFRYALAGKEDEKRVLEEIESISDKAYDSMVDQYMEFCASRSVAVSDIEEQCNWFVSRVNQIKESIRKIKLVAVGLLAAVILIYIPYIMIQFESIIKEPYTVMIALFSIAIPIALVYVIFAILASAQRKKFRKAWLEFQARTTQALEENKIAVQKYDQLLSVVIPALRWVYEYKLDVEYCAECCSVADAKVEHHRRKLRDRVTSIQNILNDLEFIEPEDDDMQQETYNTADAVDYNVSFCSGKKNRSFYSVLDSSNLKQNKN